MYYCLNIVVPCDGKRCCCLKIQLFSGFFVLQLICITISIVLMMPLHLFLAKG